MVGRVHLVAVNHTHCTVASIQMIIKLKYNILIMLKFFSCGIDYLSLWRSKTTISKCTSERICRVLYVTHIYSRVYASLWDDSTAPASYQAHVTNNIGENVFRT